MNKLVLLLGLITLTACTTDTVFDEHDQYNEALLRQPNNLITNQ